jgi:hypothetical protein
MTVQKGVSRLRLVAISAIAIRSIRPLVNIRK